MEPVPIWYRQVCRELSKALPTPLDPNSIPNPGIGQLLARLDENGQLYLTPDLRCDASAHRLFVRAMQARFPGLILTPTGRTRRIEVCTAGQLSDALRIAAAAASAGLVAAPVKRRSGPPYLFAFYSDVVTSGGHRLRGQLVGYRQGKVLKIEWKWMNCENRLYPEVDVQRAGCAHFLQLCTQLAVRPASIADLQGSWVQRRRGRYQKLARRVLERAPTTVPLFCRYCRQLFGRAPANPWDVFNRLEASGLAERVADQPERTYRLAQVN